MSTCPTKLTDRKCKHLAGAPVTKASHREWCEMSQATLASLKDYNRGGETAAGHHIPGDLKAFQLSNGQICSSLELRASEVHSALMKSYVQQCIVMERRTSCDKIICYSAFALKKNFLKLSQCLYHKEWAGLYFHFEQFPFLLM